MSLMPFVTAFPAFFPKDIFRFSLLAGLPNASLLPVIFTNSLSHMITCHSHFICFSFLFSSINVISSFIVLISLSFFSFHFSQQISFCLSYLNFSVMFGYITVFIIITIFFFESYLLMTLIIMSLHNTLSCVALSNVFFFLPHPHRPCSDSHLYKHLRLLLFFFFVPIAFNMFGVSQILQ